MAFRKPVLFSWGLRVPVGRANMTYARIWIRLLGDPLLAQRYLRDPVLTGAANPHSRHSNARPPTEMPGAGCMEKAIADRRRAGCLAARERMT